MHTFLIWQHVVSKMCLCPVMSTCKWLTRYLFWKCCETSVHRCKATFSEAIWGDLVTIDTVTVTVSFFVSRKNNIKIRTMKSCLVFDDEILFFFSPYQLFLLSLACFFASQVLKLHGFCDKGLRWKRPGSFPRSKGSWQEGNVWKKTIQIQVEKSFWLPSWNLKLVFF